MERRKDVDRQEGAEKRVATAVLFVGQLLSLTVAYSVNFVGSTHLRDYCAYTAHEASFGISTGDVVVTDVTTATITWSRPHVAL